ncbi:MAG TPA: hypothetical protein VGU46_09070 [Acidobacteriaceae bacterium]|nr:hypothetical protein [Acidobacteriaceae bacterium]
MTLLNAPEFDTKKETRKRNILIGSGVGIALLAVLSLAGFLLGHGWLFTNLPVEHKVSVFFSALQSQDYPRAYGLFYNDANWQQHPEKYKDYTLKRFTEDFTTESDWKAPVNSFHIGCSKRDATGTAVAIKVNGTSNLTLKYQKTDGTLSFFPFELSCGL